ncbi:MAG: hypothetical protein H0T46_08480 [Deltaproteobacteria bacterium]|nr:hypothetical protein [Deltaproteobacteria bacterium]
MLRFALLICVACGSSKSDPERQPVGSGSGEVALELEPPRTLELLNFSVPVRVGLRVPVGWVQQHDRPITFGATGFKDEYDRPRLHVSVTCDGVCNEVEARIRENPDQLVKRASEMTVYPLDDPRSMRIAVSTVVRGPIPRGDAGKDGTFAVIEAIAPVDKLGKGEVDVSRLEGECVIPARDLSMFIRVNFIVPRSWKGPKLQKLLTTCMDVSITQ